MYSSTPGQTRGLGLDPPLNTKSGIWAKNEAKSSLQVLSFPTDTAEKPWKTHRNPIRVPAQRCSSNPLLMQCQPSLGTYLTSTCSRALPISSCLNVLVQVTRAKPSLQSRNCPFLSIFLWGIRHIALILVKDELENRGLIFIHNIRSIQYGLGTFALGHIPSLQNKMSQDLLEPVEPAIFA